MVVVILSFVIVRRVVMEKLSVLHFTLVSSRTRACSVIVIIVRRVRVAVLTYSEMHRYG